MASQGLIPYCNIYSTFAQRAYDQIIHDVALQKLPVIFCLDRAGLVGEDGATHHGAFDISFLRCIPNLILCAPMNEIDLRNILYTAQLGTLKNPIAIRYPRGRGSRTDWKQPFKAVPIGKGKILREGNTIAILSIGTIGNQLESILENLAPEQKPKIAHYNLLFVKPLDKALLLAVLKKFDTLLTFEENVSHGGFGSAILEFAQKHHFTTKKIHVIGYPDSFVEHGSVEKLQKSIALDKDALKKVILERL
jgi:1-deoxy-D-xylulose-5-phosphate synthase